MSSTSTQSIEWFAELMARLDDPFADRAELLRAAALDESALQRLEKRFAEDLAAESDEPAKRFGDAYEAATRGMAAVRGGERAAPDLRFLNADAQSFREEAAAVLREPLTAATVAPREDSSARAIAPLAPVHVATFSAAGAAPVPRPADVSWMPEGMRGFTDVRGTQLATDTGVPRAPAVPFNPRAAPALPVQGAASRLAMIPEGMRNFTDIHGTQLADDRPVRAALPFPGADRPKAPVPASVVAPVSALPQLSIEQYASLHVELAALPARPTEILERYRITEAQRRGLDAHWTARMLADPALKQAWERACAAYKSWLARSKGAP